MRRHYIDVQTWDSPNMAKEKMTKLKTCECVYIVPWYIPSRHLAGQRQWQQISICPIGKMGRNIFAVQSYTLCFTWKCSISWRYEQVILAKFQIVFLIVCTNCLFDLFEITMSIIVPCFRAVIYGNGITWKKNERGEGKRGKEEMWLSAKFSGKES